MNWYTRISHDLAVIPDFIAHYENELISSKVDVRVSGIMKGLDAKQWQMGHIVRLRTAGMEDISVD